MSYMVGAVGGMESSLETAFSAIDRRCCLQLSLFYFREVRSRSEDYEIRGREWVGIRWRC